MKRSQPMKRSGFARKASPVRPEPVYLEERPRQLAALLRPAVIARIDDVVRAVPKVVPLESEAYRRLVAQLPCCICGRMGRSQAAHPNTNKGAGTKTDDRLTFPLCADAPGERGCHSLFDQAALFDKHTRRMVEQAYGADTRRRIELMGQWPEGLPRWSDEQGDADSPQDDDDGDPQP